MTTATIPPHLLARLSAPRASQLVHREECTQCFDTIYLLGTLGLDVCLECFNGSCSTGSTNQHSLLHAKNTGHKLVVNIIKRRKPQEVKKERDDLEPPVKKLMIREEPTEEEEYETETKVKYFDDPSGEWKEVDQAQTAQLKEVVEGVLNSMSSAQKSEVQAWEEEIVPCTHTTDLVQPSSSSSEKHKLSTHCTKCDLTSNLWLCLICGALGCGRQQFGGGGGNGHGLEHTKETGHSVAVKLGTIEPDGSADVYCYACDDARTDPHLAKHLATFGIEVASQKKTEKSMTELQVEQNMNFDFAMTGADGKELEPVFGPGLTGLKNLGNSCYMASSLQSLFSLPVFQDRYLTSFLTHTPSCFNPTPASCFECQMSKIADGLLSGRYSVPSAPSPSSSDSPSPGFEVSSDRSKPQLQFQQGIKPSMFKALVGKDHAEFSTMKQQDAGEFLTHLLEFIKRSSKREGNGENEVSADTFGFEMEERLECIECKGVRYRKQEQEGLSLPVPVRQKKKEDGMEVEGEAKKEELFEEVELRECFEDLTRPVEIEYHCPACEKKVTALKSTKFSTFPKVLIVNANRFQLENWVPRKVDVPILLDPKSVDLSAHLGGGLQAGEKELPESKDEESGPKEHSFDQASIDTLTGMGFPEIRAKRALLKTGSTGAESAMEWLFAHMDDTDLDDPLPPPESSGAAPSGGNEPSSEQISMIVDMGFTPQQGKKALLETGGDPNRAVEWLFSHPDDDGTIAASSASSPTSSTPRGSSTLPAKYRLKTFISHKGPSVHSGHYVSHVLTGQADPTGEGKGSWVLFNDEKVVRADGGEQGAEEWMKKGYVYLFERLDEQ